MNSLLKEIAKHAMLATRRGTLKWIRTDEGFRSEELDSGIIILLQRRPHGDVPEMKFGGANWMTTPWDSSEEITALWQEVSDSEHWAYIKEEELKWLLTILKIRHEPQG